MNTQSFRKTALIFIFKIFDDDFNVFTSFEFNNSNKIGNEQNDFVLERFQKKVQMVPFTIWV